MGILSARTLRDSLQKAKRVGIFEEPFTLDDLEVVVRNLRPDEYTAIVDDCKDRDGMAYMEAFQKGHVSRAIVALNGQDFRDVDFIDDEEPDPKKQGQMKPVKLEVHRWLEKNILSTWGKEAIYVAYRKVGDAVDQAEKKSQEKIEFRVEDETPEEKYRRLIGELTALQEEVPGPIVEKVLDENGYMLKTTAEEAKRAMEAAGALAWEQISKEKAAKEAEEAAAVQPLHPPIHQAIHQTPAPAPPPAQVPQAAPPQAQPLQQAPVATSDLMRNRQPLNTSPVEVTQGPGKPPPNIVPATRAPVTPPPQDASYMLQEVHPLAQRGAKMAALEAEADLVGALGTAPPVVPVRPDISDQTVKPTIVLERRQPKDPQAIMSALDQPPKAGINPHWRPSNNRKL
jgi:hypothetical protein